jgi:hypothetical protein
MSPRHVHRLTLRLGVPQHMALVRDYPLPFDLEKGSRRGLGFLCLERTIRLRRGCGVARQSLICSQNDLKRSATFAVDKTLTLTS